MNKNYLSGLFEGEGCFYIHRARNRWEVCFSIAMTDHDLIKHIYEYLGFGRLDKFKPRANKYSLLRWRCGSINDCLKLCELLDEHPMFGKKWQEYLFWRKAIHIKANKSIIKGKMSYYTEEQHNEIISLANKLKKCKVRNQG